MTTTTELDLEALDREFAQHQDPARMVRWLVDTFPLDRLMVASAMTSDVVLVDVASRVAPGIEVVFLDTGYHFAETLETVRPVGERYPIKLTITPADPIGDERYLTDVDGCCNQRKVVPLEKRAGRTARLDQRRAPHATRPCAPTRRSSTATAAGIVKLNPLAAWTDDDLLAYAAIHEVPLNPLLDQGYPSIGCVPCTRKPADGEDARAGRWSGKGKTECGLHL